VVGNVKGLQDPYCNPTTQQGWAERWKQNAVMVTSFATARRSASRSRSADLFVAVFRKT
jgi:hypothetical protein